MRMVHTGHEYEWHADSLYGVGRFLRKSDQALTLMETGVDYLKVEAILTDLDGMANHDSLLDSFASEYDYS